MQQLLGMASFMHSIPFNVINESAKFGQLWDSSADLPRQPFSSSPGEPNQDPFGRKP